MLKLFSVALASLALSGLGMAQGAPNKTAGCCQDGCCCCGAGCDCTDCACCAGGCQCADCDCACCAQ